MNAKKIHYNQNLHPTIEFLRFLKTSFISMPFDDFQDVLQSCEWTVSREDIAGNFSLQFYPETTEGISIFDKIKILDVVKIYEVASKNVPVFIGVVKTKKITGSSESGFRRVSIQGYAITGLVRDYTINLDTTAMSLTKQMASNEAIQKEISMQFANKFDIEMKTVIKAVWKYFLECSNGNSGVVTTSIGLMIQSLFGSIDSIFDVDDSTFHYPLGCIFRGQTTQSFFDIIDGLVPEPYYEKFAYTDENGKMKIKIRKVPFAPNDWKKQQQKSLFNLDVDNGKNTNNLVKSFALEQSDREVYTVFVPYLSGYPVSEDKLLKMAAQQMTGEVDSTLQKSEKFGIYGYRPLSVHFIGYVKPDGKDDSSTKSNLGQAAKELKEMYEHLPDMVGGNITMSFYNRGESAPIMCGDIVQFMGLQFYVDGVTHSWQYGQNGEINLSVSRGGVYGLDGKFNAEKTADAQIGSIANLLH